MRYIERVTHALYEGDTVAFFTHGQHLDDTEVLIGNVVRYSGRWRDDVTIKGENGQLYFIPRNDVSLREPQTSCSFRQL